jgi:hypothetical protein
MLRAVGTPRRESGILSGRKRQGLSDRTRARHQDRQRIPPELERAILSIRRRLQAHAAPATRYSLIGATAIRAELKALGVCPLPFGRTVERVLQLNGLTAARVRLAPLLPRQEYPGPQARASNHSIRWTWWDRSTSRVAATATPSGWARWRTKDPPELAMCSRIATGPV